MTELEEAREHIQILSRKLETAKAEGEAEGIRKAAALLDNWYVRDLILSLLPSPSKKEDVYG